MTMMEQNQRRQWVLAAVDQYAGRLSRYVARRLADEDAAQDVVQHALLQLCDISAEKRRELDEGNLAAWLFTICRNKAFDLIRSRKREAGPLGSSLQGVSLDGDAAEDQIDKHIASRERDPAESAESSELYARIRAAIDLLSPAQQESVDLWLEGFSYREIAEIMDRSEGNVRVLVHRALVRLRKTPAARRLLAELKEPENEESEPQKKAAVGGNGFSSRQTITPTTPK